MQLLRIYRGTNQQKAKGSSIDPPAVEKLSRIQKKSQSTQRSRNYRDCGKRKMKSLIDSQVSRLLKNNFSRREKYRYECNQACNSTKDPNSILSSQNYLSTTILSTQIPKTYTHIHKNKSNQFYISKIQTSLTNFIFQKQVKIVQ